MVGVRTGADVDQVNEKGRTPLWVAASFCSAAEARLLLDRGADIDRVDKNGKSPLLIASESRFCAESPCRAPCHARFVTLLLDRGANVELADKDGRTPMDAAKQKGHASVVEVLSGARDRPSTVSRLAWLVGLVAMLVLVWRRSRLPVVRA